MQNWATAGEQRSCCVHIISLFREDAQMLSFSEQKTRFNSIHFNIATSFVLESSI